MKKIKKCLVVFLTLLLFPTCIVGATSYTDKKYQNYDYVIDSYDINIVVNENNTFNIIEKINTYFNVEKHGIYRKIPLKNTITRTDGTTSKNKAQIKNIQVDAPCSISNSDGYKVIKIGDADKTIKGSKQYNISYTYNIGKDTGKDYDELYFDLIGSEWDNTAIDNVTFSITMPKEFDASKLGFSSGVTGTVGSNNVTYTVNGNVIKGCYKGTLYSGDALTVRLQLPEGYFTGYQMDGLTYLLIIIPVLFVLITAIMWYLFGKDNRVIKTVEFYPPEGLNSAEVGFIYKGKSTNKDAISLLIYLANKGYIKIIEKEEKILLTTKSSFRIEKRKEYDGENEIEEIFFNGLFSSTHKTHVTLKNLENKFYKTIDKIVNRLNGRENKYQIFDKKSLKKRALIIWMLIITFVLITIKPVADYSDISLVPIAILFCGIGLIALCLTLFSPNTSISVKIFMIIWGLGFGGIPWAFIVLPALLNDNFNLMIYVVGIICMIIMGIFLKLMPKRTVEGNKILGKIEGFRTFLKTAERPKLEKLVMEDPTYFYNILPYTYVLGISDKWIKKFEVIAIQAPDWYDGYGSSFNNASFGVFWGSTMASANTSMNSRPSSSGDSSSGGSFGGGGSSGGGSGGGGGGSW